MYNTRRKSVSLTSLGIHVPKSARSSSHRSPPASATTPPAEDSEQQHPSKKIKRSHSSVGDEPLSPVSSTSVSRSSPPAVKDEQPRNAARVAAGVEATPPPEAGAFKIDTEGINDEIVVGVIEQLEKTGNRPLLLKELANILQHTIGIVQRYVPNNSCALIGSCTNICDSSANQPAIISSRLATYMKRSWTALAPCPIGKELVGTHPKRIYFYLTTQPRQAFPDPPERADQVARIISPSLTSAENEDEDKLSRSRAAMSPSPEVDLSPPDMDHYEPPMSPQAYFSHAHSLSQYSTRDSSTTSLVQGQASPPLEGDEREFTQTATSLQQRRRSESIEDASQQAPAMKVDMIDEAMADDSEESRTRHNRADAVALFGQSDGHLSVAKVAFMDGSSPMLRPQLVEFDMSTGRPELNSMSLADDYSAFICETVEMDELDDLFTNY